MLYLCAVKLNQLDKIKVGIVNYLNTRPLLYGIEHSPIKNEIELIGDYPAGLAKKLLDKEIDLGLVPVAIIPNMDEYHIISDFCIGCDGPVASVCLFSDVPLQEVETILMDYQSRTSVALAKILLQKHWNISPELVDTNEDYRARIKGNTAGLVIGDRSFEQRKRSTHIYDLGEAWKQHTGLPFVFAAWISNRNLPHSFIDSFNEANRLGVENIPVISKDEHYDLFNLEEYYTRYINYELDAQKRIGLNKFLQLLGS